MAEKLLTDRLETPLGLAQLVCDAEGRLRVFGWFEREESWQRYYASRYGKSELVETTNPFGFSDAIRAYMQGDIGVIDTLPVVFAGTEFQTRVWQALRKIPAGETTTYGALAAKIGLPKAVRAVGLANGSNPIGVVVPCHRVIGAGGALTGYGSGIERKRWLLAHEARHTGTGLFRV